MHQTHQVRVFLSTFTQLLSRDIKVHITTFHMLLHTIMSSPKTNSWSATEAMKNQHGEYTRPLLLPRLNNQSEVEEIVDELVLYTKSIIHLEIALQSLVLQDNELLNERDQERIQQVLGGILECGRKCRVWDYWLSHIPEDSHRKNEHVYMIQLPTGVGIHVSKDFKTYSCHMPTEIWGDARLAHSDYTFLRTTLPKIQQL